MVKDMLAYRGMIVTHKTVREWAEKFGRNYANNIRCRTARLGDKWHLDEVVITIKRTHPFLWRAVDQDGFVLEGLFPETSQYQDCRALHAQIFVRQGVALRVVVTDKLGSHEAANKEIGLTMCDH